MMTGLKSAAILLFVALLSPAAGAGDDAALTACDEQVRRAPRQLASYSCYGFLAIHQGLWAAAVQRLEGLIAADPTNTYALGALAYVEKVRGRPRTEDLLRQILEIQQRRLDTPLREHLWTRLELVDFLAKRYRLDEADVVLAEALKEVTASGDSAAVAQVRINQAWQAWRRAEYARAELLLWTIENDVFGEHDVQTQSMWLSAMGAVYWAQGAYRPASECYERQAELLEEVGATYARAGVLYNLALVAVGSAKSQSRSVEPYLPLLEAALEAASAVGDLAVEASSLAELAIHADSVERRRRQLRRGLELARRANAVDSELTSLRGLVVSLFTEEPRDEALARQLFAELEILTHDTGDPLQIALTRATSARLAWSEADRSRTDAESRARAVDTHLGHLNAVEAIRYLQPETLARARTISRWKGAYDSLVTRLLVPPGRSPSREELDLAFRVMERMRARLLLVEMDAARVTGALVDRDAPEVRKRDELLQQIAGVQKEVLDPSLSPARRAALLEQLERLVIDEAATRQEILRTESRLAELTAPEIISLSALQQTLAEDEAFLAYQVGEAMDSRLEGWVTGSHLLAVTSRSVRHFALPAATEIEAAVELYVGLCANRDGSERIGAERLYRDLLGDALADLGPGITRLIIAPDGVLHRLPFAALLDVADDFDPGRHRIGLVPSATIFRRWRSAPTPNAPRSALAFVDPLLSGDSSDGVPPGQAEETNVARGFLPWEALAPLPRAREEARSIQRYLGRNATAVDGAAASERFLKLAELGEYAIIHFAAHAVVDDDAPERSAVVLAGGEDGEDGLLHVREVVDLDLAGKIVVLSACRSASGHSIETEGLISLARAFLVSGARAVIGSLWPLRDGEAAMFFDRFYHHVGRGSSLDAALAAAQVDRMAAGAPTAAWAGIVLIGDGSLVPVSDPSSWPDWRWIVALATATVALAVLAAIYVAWARSREPSLTRSGSSSADR
jgi:CHAT domain-containing protein